MSAETKEFIPGPDCFDPDTCKRHQKCLEASVLETRMTYEPEVQMVKYQLEGLTCQNSQATTAREKAGEFLKKQKNEGNEK